LVIHHLKRIVFLLVLHSHLFFPSEWNKRARQIRRIYLPRQIFIPDITLLLRGSQSVPIERFSSQLCFFFHHRGVHVSLLKQILMQALSSLIVCSVHRFKNRLSIIATIFRNRYWSRLSIKSRGDANNRGNLRVYATMIRIICIVNPTIISKRQLKHAVCHKINYKIRKVHEFYSYPKRWKPFDQKQIVVILKDIRDTLHNWRLSTNFSSFYFQLRCARVWDLSFITQISDGYLI